MRRLRKEFDEVKFQGGHIIFEITKVDWENLKKSSDSGKGNSKVAEMSPNVPIGCERNTGKRKPLDVATPEKSEEEFIDKEYSKWKKRWKGEKRMALTYSEDIKKKIFDDFERFIFELGVDFGQNIPLERLTLGLNELKKKYGVE